MLSWELASALKDAKARFDSAGVKLVAVGVGTPDKARMLADRVCFCCASFAVLITNFSSCFMVGFDFESCCCYLEVYDYDSGHVHISYANLKRMNGGQTEKKNKQTKRV